MTTVLWVLGPLVTGPAAIITTLVVTDWWIRRSASRKRF